MIAKKLYWDERDLGRESELALSCTLLVKDGACPKDCHSLKPKLTCLRPPPICLKCVKNTILELNSKILFEIFIYRPKVQLWFPERIVDFLGWKTCENVVVLDFLAVDNFDFTRKIVKKKFGWKTRENVGVLSKLNFWTKIWLFE